MARIMVAGGGVAGLLTARLLGASGHHVTLIERAATPPQIGAGLVLPTSTITLLHNAGVDISQAALPLTSLSITGPGGQRRASTTGRVSLARPDLISALLTDLPRYTEVRCSTRLHWIQRTPSGVRCHLTDDALKVDLLIGADGIRSTTRNHLAPQVPLRFAGQVCWRGILPPEPTDCQPAADTAGPAGSTDATELWTGSERVGMVPLFDGRTYVYYVHRADFTPAPLTSSTNTTLRSTKAAGPALPAREAAAVRRLLELPRDELLRHELWELERPVWGSGPIALVGDAAHAITPNLGLGAALALADAAALTRAVGAAQPEGVLDVGAAVRRYRRQRATSVRAVQLSSRAIGRFAHSRRPAAVFARRALSLQGAH